MLCYFLSCHAISCYARLCYAMLCYARLCYVMLCYVMICLCYAMLYHAMLCYAMVCYVYARSWLPGPGAESPSLRTGFSKCPPLLGGKKGRRGRSGGAACLTLTCLTHAFFKSGESCRKLWCSLTRRNAHKTSDAALDK